MNEGVKLMIFRAEHNENFTRIQNQLITDIRISVEARGMMVFILSLPDDWSFSIRGIASQTGLGVSTVQKLIAELKKYGYAKSETIRANGRIVGSSWEFYETPYIELPYTEKLYTEKPYTEKPYTVLPYTEKPCTVNEGTYKLLNIQTTNSNKLLNVQTTKCRYGEFSNVLMSQEEFDKLGDKLGTETRDSLIFELSCYLTNHPKKYKNHYATVLSWARKRAKEKPVPTKIMSNDPWGDLMRQEGYE